MPVVKTQLWLNKFVKACKQQLRSNHYINQCETICFPLENNFSEISPEEIQYELLSHGLFASNEWRQIEDRLKRMEQNNYWEIVDQEYQRLQKKWSGPEAAIFIFPIRNKNRLFGTNSTNKNGVAYKDAIFLFLSPELNETEVKALLAHEYNHVCRLAYLNLEANQIALKDSLILEGLGEFAVKELYGERFLGPWVNLYSLDDIKLLWKTHFIPSLNIIGREKHQIFLYGNKRPFPKLIGYNLGFQIVDSYHKKHGPFQNAELYSKSSEEIINGSIFSERN
ncbi:DUF2268 domain-containing protein [Jeotgalibacillus soli]|uniref:DUF2268 domain-containing protein n=1 Tax=Jeotgalibacillus soli TaxID=889306 RepID=A0A0C2RUF9_9BACL|nr:DUF2268 domain-containing putative Zn-dependent protease [Jeotgalibacillus soli]KIL45379.1 hypothetical protein KP78_29230 [Jeotgalibacillus soli]